MSTRKSIHARAPLTREALEKLTANDLLRLRLSDDEKERLRKINKDRENERLESVVRLQAESAPIVAELQAGGLDVRSISDLINMSDRYESAIPILLKHLQRPYSDLVRAAIARALAVPEPAVRGAWSMLVDEYRKASMGRGIVVPGDKKEYRFGTKDALACTLSVAVTDETLPELIDLLRDRSLGESRVLLLAALRKSKNPLAQMAIDELSHDPELRNEIASWTSKTLAPRPGQS